MNKRKHLKDISLLLADNLKAGPLKLLEPITEKTRQLSNHRRRDVEKENFMHGAETMNVKCNYR